MDRFIEFARVTAQEALAQADWHPTAREQQERTATIIASGVGGFGAIAEAVRITDERGPRRLSPFTAPSFLANMAAGHVSIAHGFKGLIGAPINCHLHQAMTQDGAHHFCTRRIHSGKRKTHLYSWVDNTNTIPEHKSKKMIIVGFTPLS